MTCINLCKLLNFSVYLFLQLVKNTSPSELLPLKAETRCGPWEESDLGTMLSSSHR